MWSISTTCKRRLLHHVVLMEARGQTHPVQCRSVNEVCVLAVAESLCTVLYIIDLDI